MGQLRYGPDQSVTIDDELLAHLEAASISKLRRGEPFALRLDEVSPSPCTVWVGPASQLVFIYEGQRPAIIRAWLEALVDAANTPAGLRLLPAPVQ